MTDKDQVRYAIIRGLLPRIRAHVLQSGAATLDDVITAARTAEAAIATLPVPAFSTIYAYDGDSTLRVEYPLSYTHWGGCSDVAGIVFADCSAPAIKNSITTLRSLFTLSLLNVSLTRIRIRFVPKIISKLNYLPSSSIPSSGVLNTSYYNLYMWMCRSLIGQSRI